MGAKGFFPLSWPSQKKREKGKGDCSYHSRKGRGRRIDRKKGKYVVVVGGGGVSDWLFLATLMALGGGKIGSGVGVVVVVVATGKRGRGKTTKYVSPVHWVRREEGDSSGGGRRLNAISPLSLHFLPRTSLYFFALRRRRCQQQAVEKGKKGLRATSWEGREMEEGGMGMPTRKGGSVQNWNFHLFFHVYPSFPSIPTLQGGKRPFVCPLFSSSYFHHPPPPSDAHRKRYLPVPEPSVGRSVGSESHLSFQSCSSSSSPFLSPPLLSRGGGGSSRSCFSPRDFPRPP